ncbi:hypothetical protein D3C85_1190080 [compost metagenome]
MVTSSLIGLPLDWAVAQATDTKIIVYTEHLFHGPSPIIRLSNWDRWEPSINWNQCGPLIEEFLIQLIPSGGGWEAQTDLRLGSSHWVRSYGETPMVSICRAVVMSKFGDTVSIPKELLE